MIYNQPKPPYYQTCFVKEYKPISYEVNPANLPEDTQVNNSPQCVRICNEKKKRWKLWILWLTWCTCFLQQLESLSWHRNGTEFMSAHNDGSYIIWSSTNSAEPKDPALTPYGKELKGNQLDMRSSLRGWINGTKFFTFWKN